MVFEPKSRPKMQYHPANTRDTETEINKVLDDALEKLRWARAHVQEQRAPIEMRDLATRLGYLAQALTWEMDGQPAKADMALNLAQGVSRRQQEAMRQAWEDMWWSH
jgi:hypothetical protein